MQYEGEKTRGQENKKTRELEDERTRGHINHRGFKAKNSFMSRFFDELCSQLFEGKTPPYAAKMKQWGLTPMFHLREKRQLLQRKMKQWGLTPMFHFYFFTLH